MCEGKQCNSRCCYFNMEALDNPNAKKCLKIKGQNLGDALQQMKRKNNTNRQIYFAQKKGSGWHKL